MRSALILFCIAVQLGVLAYMVYGRESVVAGGQRIYMATAPLDPRDPFRGDFVRLQYPANNINSAPQQWSDADNEVKKGEVVYAQLEEKPSGLHEVVLFTDTQPENGLFIRGRKASGRSFVGRGSQADVRFGIEQLFVQQGSGIDIEEKRGIRGGLQTAMEVEIAVNSKGTAVLTGYRWSDLGIQLDLGESFRLSAVDATANTSQNTTGNADSDTAGPHIIVTIQNVSEDPVTLNNPGENCGFRLQPANLVSPFREAPNSCTTLDSVEPLTLLPNETHVIEIDLTDPRWFVEYNDNGKLSTGDLREFDNNEMMRVVYRGAVLPARAAGDSGVPELWPGDLLSQGFNSSGRVD